MKQYISIFLICLMPVLFLGCKKKKEPPIIENATFRVVPGARAGAVFFKVTNKNDGAIELLSATCEYAGRVEIHDHVIEGNGVARMVAVRKIEVPAKEKDKPGEVELKRGGKHLMLFDLEPKIFESETLKGTLTFSTGPVDVTFTKEK